MAEDLRLKARTRLGTVAGFGSSGFADFGRNQRGEFVRDWQNRVARANEVLAERLAEAVAASEQRTRLTARQSAATFRLRDAILDPANRSADANGFGVMSPEFLNHAAPYWRLINDGTDKFKGRYIRFLVRGGKTFPDPHGGAIRMANQKVLKDGSSRLIDEYGAFRTASGAKQIGKIVNPIRPQRYIERAVEQFDVRKELEDLIRELGR